MITIEHTDEGKGITVTATGEAAFYAVGFREPHYPVPATDDHAMECLSWTLIRHWPCCACADSWSDAMDEFQCR